MTKRVDRPEDSCCEGCFGMIYLPEFGGRFIECLNPRSDHYGHVLDVRHSCQEFGVQAPDDFEWFHNPAAVFAANLEGPARARMEKVIEWSHAEAEKYRDRAGGSQPGRVVNAIARLHVKAFSMNKRIEDLTDKEMLTQSAVGPGILAEIRKLIPGPEAANV